MPERETGNERFARLDREAQTYLAAMPEAERRALRAAWEAQRPTMELAVGTPPSRFINCWAAARAFVAARGGTEDALRVALGELLDAREAINAAGFVGRLSPELLHRYARAHDAGRAALAAGAASTPEEGDA